MNKQIQQAIPYVGVGITALLAIFFFQRSQQLQQQLDAPPPHTFSRQDSLALVLTQRLEAIDSLLVEERFAEARRALGELLPQIDREENLAPLVQLQSHSLEKLEFLRERLRMYEGKDPYRELSATLLEKRAQIDSLSEQLAALRQRQEAQQDSLNFALEKAHMRTEILKSQLASTASLGYLSFPNAKGVEVHYVGEVAQEKANGWGTGLTDAGIRYEGEWKDNQFHGQGVLHWPDQEYYKGAFEKGQRHGHGNYYWPDGEMFSGEWKNDQRNGPGVFYGKNGKIMAQGTWENNELVKVKKK